MENDVKKFLDSIQELKEQTFDVNRISTGDSVKCKKISFKQQKNIMSTVTEGTSGILRFQKILNDIIMENTDTNDWLVIDKIPVLMKMRIESLGSVLKHGSGDIDLNTLKFENKKDVKTTTKIDNVVGATLKIPTLTEENKILNYAIDITKNSKESDVGRDITNIFTFEIVKFIDTIDFDGQTLKFDSLPVKDRILVVENLPISLNKEIVKYIESVKEIENDYLKVVVDGEELRIDIDVTFFDN
jgi:hypothetical protein